MSNGVLAGNGIWGGRTRAVQPAVLGEVGGSATDGALMGSSILGGGRGGALGSVVRGEVGVQQMTWWRQ